MPIVSREFKEAAAPYFSGEKPAFATTLLAALIRLNGAEVLEWDPLTIELEVKEDLGVEMPRKVYDKLLALISALSTDSTYKDVALFDETVNALAGKGVGVERDVPPVDEVAWAVTELRLNDPEPVSRSPEQPFAREIQRYARVVLDDEGMKIAPKALDFAANRPVKQEGADNPDFYAAAWGSAQARADEVDQWIEGMVIQLIHQLMSIGIDFPQVKEGEWTSDKNKLTHVAKHGPEFGGAEAYLAAEKEYSQKPGGSVSVEHNCRTDAEGNVRCAKKTEFEDGVVRVSREDDDRTITLYQRLPMHQHLSELAKSRRN